MKTALNYVFETIKMYESKSPYNPNNQATGFFANHKEWAERLEKEILQIKLNTILERLPYDPLNKKEEIND